MARSGSVRSRRRLGGLAVACVAAFAGGLGAAPSAQAVVTIGSALTAPPASSPGCSTMPCSLSPTAIPGRTVASPVNGTVTTWRVLGAAGEDFIRFRVVRPFSGGLTFLSSSATEHIPTAGDVLYTFPTSLPISVGDRIAVDDEFFQGGNLEVGSSSTGSAYNTFQPIPANGTNASPKMSWGGEVLLNADVKPDILITVGRPIPLPIGIIKLKIDVPNPGLLVATGAKPPPPSAQAAAKAKQKLIKRAKKTVAAPGEVTLKLVPSKATRKRLQERGRAKGTVTVSFTAGGETSSRSMTVKFRLRR